jgi:hypothetical protein
VSLLLVREGAVVTPVVAGLTDPLTVNTVQEFLTVGAGDDDLFPSFQLGYFTTSPIASEHERPVDLFRIH